MDKVRVHEIATELGIKSKEVIDKASNINIAAKTASSTVSIEEAEKLMNYIMSGVLPPEVKKSEPAPVEKVDSPKAEAEEQRAPLSEPKVETLEEKVKKSSNEESVKIESTPKETPAEKPRVRVRRKGLKIVKKRKALPVSDSKSSTHTSFNSGETVSGNYGKLSQEALQELANKKSKKVQHGPAEKKEHGERIDIFETRNFGDSGGTADENNQVVLLDYRERELSREFDDQNRAKQTRKKETKNAAARNFAGHNNRPKGLSRRKRKKRRVVKGEGENIIVSSIEIPEDIRVYEFAEKINHPISDIIKTLFNLGMMVTKNDYLDKDAIEVLAEEFEVEVHTVDLRDQFDYEKQYDEDEQSESSGEERPPIVAIMGHVDHGKTTLLDTIRSSKVADREAGGITQHIGAYSIEQNSKLITFLDTPGHAAFSAMRARGASLTDIIVIVVAADDGVKPQTKEAVEHAKESQASIIVAINKMDKPEANPDLVMSQMAEIGLTPVEWGGTTEFIKVSAKAGDGINELLENILIQAELLELKADSSKRVKSVVVESSVEKGRGPVATVIVQNGTLRVGDNVVVGAAFGRVKLILDDNKKVIKEIGPSQTGVVIGLDRVPNAGEILVAVDSDKKARSLAEKRHEYDRNKELSISTKVSLDELSSMIAEGNLNSLKVILKTDVHGTLEAIKSSLDSLRNEEVKVDIISSSVGGITESDVELSNNSENSVIIGFNVRPTGGVKAKAKQYGVDIKTYSVIYELINEMTGILTGMMSPVMREENSGQAEVRDTFSIPKSGTIAGCMVQDGQILRGGKARVIREGIVIFTGEINSLKRFKDDVKEVGKGHECGIILEGYDDVLVGDTIETFKEVAEKAKSL